MDGIFISYRRDDSAGYAGRLYDRLIPHFGAERVFMDVEGIELGIDFVTAIEEAVGSCRVLIVIIGDEWLKTTDAAGRRRLEDPHDFIRLETVTALQRGIRVVPVLVGGALMPRAEDLPEDLKPLARRQAIEISHKQWEATTAELIRALEAILSTGRVDEPSPRDKVLLQTPPAPPPAPPPDGGGAGTGGRARRWPLVTVALLAVFTLAGGGLWALLSPREADKPTQAKSERQRPAKAPSDDAPAVVRAPPPSRGPAVAAGTSPKPTVPAAAPSSPAASPPVAATTPVPAPVPAAPEEPVAPTIRSFHSTAEVGGARLCYSVAHADSLTLSPRPGDMSFRIKHCVRVELDGPTTFTLTARNAVKTVSKTLTVSPRAAAVAAAPVAPAEPAPAAPRAPPVAAVDSALPRVGESWTYRTSGKWPTSPKRSIVIAVQSVSNGVVTEGLRAEGLAADVRRSTGSRPTFMSWNEIGNEFSPYLAAYSNLSSLGTLSGFATPDVAPNWSQWYSEAKVIGQETVTVPAGSFQTHKVEVWSSRRATGGPTQAGVEPVRIQYLIWYTAETKRYVKMRRRVISASGAENERDVFELVAHR